jgi:lipopolysaccharide/colanic/teichoic acid biosynthesis glycosyltransferase
MRHDSSGTLAGWENIDCDVGDGASRAGTAVDGALKRALDIVVAAGLLLVLAPVILIVALMIRLESSGPSFYRCPRVGRGGREFGMLKFRKMRNGAQGPALASWDDERFTRLGPFLARTKLDEVPQLWNVLSGQMSLVGPRPEVAAFVEIHPAEFTVIHSVKPGMTGLCQLAFAQESYVLNPEDRLGHYVNQILPQKIAIDQLYASRRSFAMDTRILAWTALAVLVRREVAVHRRTGDLSLREPRVEAQEVGTETQQVAIDGAQA